MAHTETMLESREIFNGHVIRVTVDKVQLEDGTTSTREIVHHHGGACILPVDADGSVTMVRQFRYAFGEEIWELPAGKLEADEDPFEAAKRELSEECGLTADNFIDLGVVYATVGYDSEKICGPPPACTAQRSTSTRASSLMSSKCRSTRPSAL